MKEFNTEFMSNEEVDEALDSITLDIARAVAESEAGISIANSLRLEQLLFTYKTAKHMMRGKPVKVSYKLYEPFQSMGSVSIIGRNIVMQNAEWFAKLMEFASNFEVYPRTDGTVCMTFTFHDLTTHIE